MKRRGVRPIEVRTPRIVPHDERRPVWWWLLGVVLLAAALWQSFELGKRQDGLAAQRLAGELQGLRAQLDDQARRLAAAQAEAARYRRQAEVAEEAGRRAQQEIAALQEERARLRSEVELLKQLVARGSGTTLYVRDLILQPGAEPGRYHYQFTLVQLKESRQPTRGKLVMKILGRQGKKARQLDRSQFSPDGEKTMKLEFTNFQDVSGDIQLPEGFRPEKLRIEFLPRGNQKKLEITFPWPTAEAAHGQGG